MCKHAGINCVVHVWLRMLCGMGNIYIPAWLLLRTRQVRHLLFSSHQLSNVPVSFVQAKHYQVKSCTIKSDHSKTIRIIFSSFQICRSDVAESTSVVFDEKHLQNSALCSSGKRIVGTFVSIRERMRKRNY